MEDITQDPIAKALKDYLKGEKDAMIHVRTDISEWEDMPASYFFRDLEEMPEQERIAMSLARGRILDVGAGAGCHSVHLQAQGYEVLAVEQSCTLCEVLKHQGVRHVQTDIRAFDTNMTYDSILLLMNGIGMAGTLNDLKTFLATLTKFLSPEGQIILDSGDIQHLYLDDEDALVVDLSKGYYGEIEYEVEYAGIRARFPWLFVDEDRLRDCARDAKLECEKVWEEESSFLMLLKRK